MQHLSLHAVDVLVLQSWPWVPATRQRVGIPLAFAAKRLAMLGGRAEADSDGVGREPFVDEEVLDFAITLPPLDSASASLSGIQVFF